MKIKPPSTKQAVLSLAGFVLMVLSWIVEGEQLEDSTREIVREELERLQEGEEEVDE